MKLSGKESFSKLLGKRTLIVGEVNSGKTTLTQKILDGFFRENLGGSILVLDLAPEIPPDLASRKGLSGVGGSLRVPQRENIRYLRPSLVPPRLLGKSEEQALELARRNLESIEETMELAQAGEETLFLNDASMYLQAGSAQELVSWLERFRTVVANGYMGQKLGGGKLSMRERSQMEALVRFFHEVVWLGRPGAKILEGADQ